uniref:RING-type domain-containing protein n=1 Tax=Oryza punctata TaxID=4537 RepID=A0A0E0KM00_ORYPU
MGTGWRRALCTSVRRDPEQQEMKRRGEAPSPRCSRLGGFFSAISSSNSNPATTPTLRCRTKPKPQSTTSDQQQPSSAPAPKKRMPLLQALSVPSSPRSPSRFALLKASILPSKSRCGVCSHGVKTGAAAVFTAECSHSFHFPCIAAHAHASAATALSCPVCAAPWRQAPFINTYNKRTTSSCADDDARSPRHKRKAYDDDEPLLAPKAAAAAGAFNPIPEDDEDDATEFRGFFPPRPRTGLAVTVAPDAALVSSGRRHGKYVVAVRVKAPGLRSSPSTRAPIDLVTVLDVSQGMMGDKLQMLKRGMRLVIASLGPADRLAIVAFSGAAKRLLPLRRMTRQGQRSARQIVDRLVVCAAAQGLEQPQAICVGDALRKATKVLEDRRDRNPVATVMLLSDTQQQQQQQQQDARKPGAIRRPPAAPPATRFTHIEIPIGPGEEPARSALVAEEDEQMGDAAFSEHAFAKCLGGLVSVVMQEVQLELAFPTGEITAVYSCGHGQQAVALGGGGAAVSVSLGEMYAEEERELLVELRAPLSLSLSHPHSLSVRCSYREPASQETVRGAEQQLLVPPLHGGSSSRRLHDLFVATRAVAESRRLAELNDYATAIHLLSSARALVVQSQQQQELVGSLDTELSDMRWRRGQQPRTPTSAGRRRGESDETPVGTPRGGEPLTPTSAWRAAEQLAKVAIMRKSMNRVSDLHGFENARF